MSADNDELATVLMMKVGRARQPFVVSQYGIDQQHFWANLTHEFTRCRGRITTCRPKIRLGVRQQHERVYHYAIRSMTTTL
jgi:hypothetical protein